MKYGLYEEAKNSPIVEAGVSKAIADFVQTIKDLDKNHRGTGVSDTAAKEIIAECVAEALFD